MTPDELFIWAESSPEHPFIAADLRAKREANDLAKVNQKAARAALEAADHEVTRTGNNLRTAIEAAAHAYSVAVRLPAEVARRVDGGDVDVTHLLEALPAERGPWGYSRAKGESTTLGAPGTFAALAQRPEPGASCIRITFISTRGSMSFDRHEVRPDDGREVGARREGNEAEYGKSSRVRRWFDPAALCAAVGYEAAKPKRARKASGAAGGLL